MRNPKAKKQEQTIERAMTEQTEEPVPIVEKQTLVIGVDAVASKMKRSRRTVIEWRQVYADFPVHSDPFCVWESTDEEIAAWMKKHEELFKTREERKLENSRFVPKRRW